jgi:hypothetical protein
MKKTLATIFAAATMLSAAGNQTFTGTVTDDMCGGSHKEMNMGTDAKCISECVKGMGAKYVLYDGKDSYVLSDQAKAAKFAAKKVTVTGTLDAGKKTLQVSSIAAAK